MPTHHATRPGAVQIRPAVAADCAAATDMVFRSKAHWDYPAEMMESFRDELRVDEAFLARCPTYVLLRSEAGETGEDEGTIGGLVALERLSDDEVDLALLFVDPGAMGLGYGRALLDHAVEAARSVGFARMAIQSDPGALGFYQAMGAEVVGRRESDSIEGRFLPLLELKL